MTRSLPAALLIDMDGTLADTEHWWLEGETAVLEPLGVPWSYAAAKQYIGASIDWSAEKIARDYNLDITGEELARRLVQSVHDVALREGPLWQPGAREMLSLARRLEIPTVLVTSSWEPLTDVVISRAPQGTLTTRITGENVERGKPAPDPYLAAAAAVGASPDECVAFEDSRYGLISATAARTRTVAVPFVAPIPRHPSLTVIESLEEVDEAFLRRMMTLPLPAVLDETVPVS